ncbi:hypothetical protein [Desulfosporosinus hippei]|nr:hypothetical protein [Desulfosporosinus hippei]
MIKSVVCWGRSKMGQCPLYRIERKSEDIRIAKLCLSSLFLMQAKLKKCVESNKIEEVLRFREDYVDWSYWDEVEEKELKRLTSNSKDTQINSLKRCKLDMNICKISLDSKESAIEKLHEEIDSKIKLYNDDLAIIKKVQNYCDNYENEDYRIFKNDRIYLKFQRDKYNALIALYFNVDSFIKQDSQSPVETIFVFSGEGEYPFHKQTVLHLAYEKYGGLVLSGTEVMKDADGIKDLVPQAHICDFQSYNRRRGHGSFILKHLENIVSTVNNRILSLGVKYREKYYWMKPIKAINGEVVPGGNISKDDLVKFYNKNGLPTIGRKYSSGTYVADKVIYKILE